METLRRLDDCGGERFRYLSQQEAQEQDVIDAVVAVLDAAVTLRTVTDGSGTDRISHCAMCGCWDDDHKERCLIPQLEAWLEQTMNPSLPLAPNAPAGLFYVVCAWCKAMVQEGEGRKTPTNTSHGICKRCQNRVNADLRREQ